MARRHYHPTLRTRRLAAELRALREKAGLTLENAAARLKEQTGGRWSKTKIVRLETGDYVQPATRDIEDMIDAYGETTADRRQAIIALAKSARERNWWTAYNDVWTGAYVGFEAEAQRIQTFQATFVPGLLQTEAYARALFEAKPELLKDPDALQRRLDARMARRESIVGRPSGGIWAVIDEAAILRPVGGARVMREQIESLAADAMRPGITIQLLPLSVGAHTGMDGAFVILDFADSADLPVVHTETATDALLLEGREEVANYTERFDHLKARSLGPPESIAYLRRLAISYSSSHEERPLELGRGAVAEVEPKLDQR